MKREVRGATRRVSNYLTIASNTRRPETTGNRVQLNGPMLARIVRVPLLCFLAFSLVIATGVGERSIDRRATASGKANEPEKRAESSQKRGRVCSFEFDASPVAPGERVHAAYEAPN